MIYYRSNGQIDGEFNVSFNRMTLGKDTEKFPYFL